MTRAIIDLSPPECDFTGFVRGTSFRLSLELRDLATGPRGPLLDLTGVTGTLKLTDPTGIYASQTSAVVVTSPGKIDLSVIPSLTAGWPEVLEYKVNLLWPGGYLECNLQGRILADL